ncbi:hypothetical protein ACFONL_23295, partial [Camelimonas fluminis]
DPDTLFPQGFGKAISWRGSYDEIAFIPDENTDVQTMHAHALAANGKTMEGYKGGNYEMGPLTPCNIAGYGCYGGDDDRLTLWRWRCMCALAGVPFDHPAMADEVSA